MIGNVPPFVILMLGAGLVPQLRGRVRQAYMLALPVLSFIHLLSFEAGTVWQATFLDYQLVPVRVDKLSLLFGYLFHIALFIGLVYSLVVKDKSQHFAAITYAASAIGAVFAGDLITLFVFWELLAVTSVFLILARKTERAYHAAMRYLLIQVASGVILLAGVVLLAARTGSIAFEHMELDSWATGLIFLAFGVKAAFPFLHNWLTDAYPEATVTGAIFLTSYTTKVAVYCLARGFAGAELNGFPILIYIGAAMTAFPIFYAVIENDLRRVLAYSMINQIGFMVCGVGIGTELALNGAVSHALNDVIFKGLLFMAMGAVLYRTGKINGSDLGGLYRTMPKTTILCMVGAASISAFPLFSGFVSKSMVMSAAIHEGHTGIWFVLLFASAGVFHHAGIKIPFFAFFAHDSGIRTEEAPRSMLVAMTIAAALCIGIGCFPQVLYTLLPYDAEYHPYTLSHILTQVQLLFFAAMAFTWLKLSKRYPPELPSINIDAEWTYRRLAPAIVSRVSNALVLSRGLLYSLVRPPLSQLTSYVSHLHGPEGLLARAWPTGATAMWVAVLLGLTLIFFYM